MKRLQIMIEEDLDAVVERVAQDRGISKAAVIRAVVRDQLDPLPPLTADPLARMTGADDFPPGDVDDVVYG